jgi:Na+-translocating ferredoxin:NAD+ oxidoreductase subunit G
MAKLKSSLKNMIASLSLIAAGMSAALGFVYINTKGPIEASQRKKVEEAIKAVIPDFDNTVSMGVMPETGPDSLIFYLATKGGQDAGTAIKTYTDMGFSGRFTLMVGFLPDGSISDIMVLDQKETPGLGTLMSEPKFKDQFKGLNLATFPGQALSVNKDGGSIDAITASTITSRAFCDAVNRAYTAFSKRKGGAAPADTSAVEADTLSLSDPALVFDVLPPCDNNPFNEISTINGLETYKGTKMGKMSGLAVKSFAKGYNGNIWILVGFQADGTIYGIRMLKQSESKGKGSQVADEVFIKQFYGKHPAKDKLFLNENGGNIDAISHATISCDAFCKAVENAWLAFQKGGQK